MNALDLLKLGGMLGVAYAMFWQLRKDVNGIGVNQRKAEGKAERRWKHSIAAQIEASATLDEAKKYAELLRQDAYRD